MKVIRGVQQESVSKATSWVKFSNLALGPSNVLDSYLVIMHTCRWIYEGWSSGLVVCFHFYFCINQVIQSLLREQETRVRHLHIALSRTGETQFKTNQTHFNQVNEPLTLLSRFHDWRSFSTATLWIKKGLKWMAGSSAAPVATSLFTRDHWCCHAPGRQGVELQTRQPIDLLCLSICWFLYFAFRILNI